MGPKLEAYERFLRLHPDDDIGVLMRARAAYVICWAFVFMQVLNFIQMRLVYGEYTLDHTVSILASIVMIAVTHMLRYTKRFEFFAAFYSVLLLSGICLSSMPDGTGIHSALLPLLVAGAIMNGFISGWKTVLTYMLSSLIVITLLYHVSLSAPEVPLGGTGNYEARTKQRAIQTALALTLCSAIVAMFSMHMYRLFGMLENSVKKAKRADMAKSLFLANMSHELRTPLNGVLGMTELLSRTDLDPVQKKYTNIVSSCSQSLVTIINDVLDLSKLDAGKIEVKFEAFNLRETIISLMHLHYPAAMKKNLKLYLDYPKDLPSEFMGDESRLRQIVNNLMGNAVKFTDTGSVSLYIKGFPTAEGNFQLSIYVKDTGIGIAQKDLKNIFKRFEQVDNRLSSQSAGTGLGLAISSELINLMGGQLEVKSEPGSGTTFYFNLEMIVPPQAWTPQDKNGLSETVRSAA